jgi:hypothetical protein
MSPADHLGVGVVPAWQPFLLRLVRQQSPVPRLDFERRHRPDGERLDSPTQAALRARVFGMPSRVRLNLVRPPDEASTGKPVSRQGFVQSPTGGVGGQLANRLMLVTAEPDTDGADWRIEAMRRREARIAAG